MTSSLTEVEMKSVMDGFAEYFCDVYKKDIQQQVTNQKFRYGRYIPLSEAYLSEKAKKGRKLGFWVSSRFLIEHLTWWLEGNTYMIGFKPGIMHPDSNTDLTEIALSLEFGVPAIKLPKRPLFLPTAKALSKQIYPYFERYVRESRSDLVTYLDP